MLHEQSIDLVDQVHVQFGRLLLKGGSFVKHCKGQKIYASCIHCSCGKLSKGNIGATS